MSETHVAPKPPVDPNAANAEPAPARKADRRMQAVGNSLTVLGVMLLTFIVTVTLIGELQFSRDQKTMYDNFRGALANATAPVSQLTATGGLVPLGTPMALLKFPSVTNQTFVVVEGTTSDVLMAGPGHRRDTVLPGQGGLSVIFGRRALFGERDVGEDRVALDRRHGVSLQDHRDDGTGTLRLRCVANSSCGREATADKGRRTTHVDDCRRVEVRPGRYLLR